VVLHFFRLEFRADIQRSKFNLEVQTCTCFSLKQKLNIPALITKGSSQRFIFFCSVFSFENSFPKIRVGKSNVWCIPALCLSYFILLIAKCTKESIQIPDA
jgi:hypothetical protein